MPETKLENEVLNHIYQLLKKDHTITITTSTSFEFETNDSKVIFKSITDTSNTVTTISIYDIDEVFDIKKYRAKFTKSKEDTTFQLQVSLQLATQYYNDTPIDEQIALNDLREAYLAIKDYIHYKYIEFEYVENNGSRYYELSYIIGGFPIKIILHINEFNYQIEPQIGGNVMPDVRTKIIKDSEKIQTHLNSIY